MDKNKTITPGENLKRIRKGLGLRQHEIVGDEVTRNLISMIEHNKSPLNYRVAKVIATNINNISKERDLGVYVAPEDIVEPMRVEAKEKADKYIEELREAISNKNYDLDEKYIREITDFLNQWQISDKKVVIFDLLADIYYFKKDLQGEYLYLNKALENYYMTPIKEDMHIIGRKLMSSCIGNERYLEAIRISELDFMNKKEISDKFRASIYYNKGLSHKRLGNYDKALDIVNYIEVNFREVDELLMSHCLILKGTCYKLKGDTNKAIKVYEEVVKIFGERRQEVGLAYSNILIMLRQKDLREKVIEYKNKLMEVLPKVEMKDNKHLIHIYYRLGQTYEYLNDASLAEYYYIKAINKETSRNEKDWSSNILFELLNLYITSDQIHKVFLDDSIFKRVLKSATVNDEMKLAFNLILVNIQNDRKEGVIELIESVLKEDDTQ